MTHPITAWPVNVDKLRARLTDAGFTGRCVARCDEPRVYKDAIARWAENFEGLPALVVFPETEEQVAVVVSCGCPFRLAFGEVRVADLRCVGR